MAAIPPEAWSALGPSLIGIIGSLLGLAVVGIGAVAAWLRMKTRKWDSEWADMQEKQQQTAEVMKNMIRENTDITKKIQKQTDGAHERLAKEVSTANERAGQLKERLAMVSTKYPGIARDMLDDMDVENSDKDEKK